MLREFNMQNISLFNKLQAHLSFLKLIKKFLTYLSHFEPFKYLNHIVYLA